MEDHHALTILADDDDIATSISRVKKINEFISSSASAVTAKLDGIVVQYELTLR